MNSVEDNMDNTVPSKVDIEDRLGVMNVSDETNNSIHEEAGLNVSSSGIDSVTNSVIEHRKNEEKLDCESDIPVSNNDCERTSGIEKNDHREETSATSKNTAETETDPSSSHDTGTEDRDDDKVDEQDKEDEFQACEDSGSSSSEDEYESAEEGEEMKADAQTLAQMEEALTDEEKEERRRSAQQMKEEGNSLFKCGSYKSAIKMYSRALRTCPLKFIKERSIMYSNRAACKMRLEEDEAAIKDCTKAVDLHPHYLRPLLRRAELYEKTDKLDEALADYQKVLELDPAQHGAREACMKLPDQIKDRNEKLKAEMMGKLKDLGNMILRPFGLSTENFQLNQDPNTGGYSVNFQQNPGQN